MAKGKLITGEKYSQMLLAVRACQLKQIKDNSKSYFGTMITDKIITGCVNDNPVMREKFYRAYYLMRCFQPGDLQGEEPGDIILVEEKKMANGAKLYRNFVIEDIDREVPTITEYIDQSGNCSKWLFSSWEYE